MDHTANQHESASTHGVASVLSSRLVVAIAFLLPIFFIPSSSVTLQFGKGFFLFIATAVLALAVLSKIWNSKSITFPKSYTAFGLLSLPIVYLISATFSGSQKIALVGSGFELDTAVGLVVLSALALLVPLAIKTKPAIFNVFIATISSFFVVSLFEIIRFIFGADTLSFGVFTSNVSNLVGTWNDLAVFGGFAVVFALVSLAMIESTGVWRKVLYTALGLGLATLAVVNFAIVWVIVAFFAIATLLYVKSLKKGEANTENKRTWGSKRASLIALAFAVIFLIDGQVSVGASDFGSTGPITTGISKALNIVHLEARPSLSATLGIARATLAENPILGAGPSQFINEWLKNKPRDVNDTTLWSVDFYAGVGTIPSALITVGLLGILAWVLLLVAFFIEGVKALFRLRGEPSAHYLALASFVSALYFWIVALVYTPTHTPFVLAFLFTGIFLTALMLEGAVNTKTILYGENPSKTFATNFVSLLLIILIALGVYSAVQRFYSYVMFNRAVSAYVATNDLGALENSARRALAFESSDTFYRLMEDVYINRMSQTLAVKDAKPEDVRNQIQVLLGASIESGRLATVVNPQNYTNWIWLAKAYESVVPLKVPGAYERAKEAYAKALEVNPSNPAIVLAMAKLELSNGNAKTARELALRSTVLKRNFTEAVFFVAQIDAQNGDIDKAIEGVKNALLFSPNDPLLNFQLGFLEYNSNSYKESITAFERAVALQPVYANARYFLGLSYSKVGRTSDAINQFVEVEKTNPDNAEVKSILENLRAGRAPFARVTPPNDDKPEKRSKLPVSDTPSNN